MGPFLAFPASRQGGDGLECTALTDSCRCGRDFSAHRTWCHLRWRSLHPPDSSHSDSAAGTGLHAPNVWTGCPSQV